MILSELIYVNTQDFPMNDLYFKQLLKKVMIFFYDLFELREAILLSFRGSFTRWFSESIFTTVI